MHKHGVHFEALSELPTSMGGIVMLKLTYVVFALIMGAICYYVAKKRGMPHPGLWFVAGVLFHVVAVAVITFAVKIFNSRKKRGVS